MIPQPFTMAIPLLAANVAAWLKDDGLPKWLNYAIIVVFFVISVWASLYLEGHLTGDITRDIAIVIAECLAVFQSLQPAVARSSARVPSPLLALRRPAPSITSQSRVSQAISPPLQRNWKATTQVWPAAPKRDDSTVPLQSDAKPPDQAPPS